MKILITTDWYAPTVNGVVMSVLNLRKELIRLGNDVRILTLSQNTRSFEKNGVTYIGSIGAGKLYPGARIKIGFNSRCVQDILKWKPDIIHSQCEFSTFLIARRIAKELDIPIIHTYHTVYEDYTHYFSPSKKWGRRMVEYMTRWVVKQTACVIAPTEKVKRILKGYGINKDINVIPTGIDMKRFTKNSSAEKKSELKKKLGIPEKDHILLYVGRLAKEKNIEEILNYHAECHRKDITLLIAGDGPHREELEHMTSNLGINDSVKFTGMIAPKEINDYYNIGDLFVSASVSETQGLTYIEALACGLPVLCRKDECLEGVVLDGINGWVYENEQDYLEKLNSFFENTVMQKNMGEQAEKSAWEMFSSTAFAEKVESVYSSILN